MTPACTDPRLRRIVGYFESLTPEAVESLGEQYTPDAWFKDPFNEVRGTEAIQGIFRHMYRSLEAPRFVVTTAISQADEAFLTWDFHFSLKRGGALVVRGASHLKFAGDGRVAWHRDYWDAAEELYEKLPLVGALMRWLRRRVNA